MKSIQETEIAHIEDFIILKSIHLTNPNSDNNYHQPPVQEILMVALLIGPGISYIFEIRIENKKHLL